MDSMLMSSLLAVLFLAHTTISLQVSSNSPCTSLCSSSSSSSTLGSEIACLDVDYAGSPTGQKFMSCVSCLQTSTASDENGSDQEWFLYNLRFALYACLFGFQQPSDSVTPPCSTSESCQPLQLALGDGNLVPSHETEYSYCTTDSNAILGSSLNLCKDCLSNTSDEKYLRNFLTALQAGCVQQPPTGNLIGLEGSVFSTTPINITFPGSNQSATPSSKTTHKSGLPQGAIIGIAVGLAVLFLVTVAILIIYAWKRRNWNRLRQQLNSPLHSRFGAPNITAPTNGAYGNPYAPPTAVNQPFDPSEYSVKELTVLDSAQAVLGQHQSPIDLKDAQGWYNNRLASQLSKPPGPAIPTHQAYIPNSFPPLSPSSPTVSDATSDTYHMKEDRSSRSSPKYTPKYTPKHVPPPLILEPKPPLYRRSPSTQVQVQIPDMRAINSTQGFPPSPPQAVYEPQSQSQPLIERNRSLSCPRVESRTRDESRARAESRADGYAESSTRVESRSGNRTRHEGGAQSRTREDSPDRLEGFPRVSPPGLHSQRMELNEQGPSRSASRADSSKRTTVRPGIRNTNASIDAPLVMPGGRFDFELAERERLDKERMEALASITKDSFKKKKKKPKPEDATPISAESVEEQWPGCY